MESTEYASAVLAELRQLGVQLAIDDFGTGYSSLSYVHRFPLNSLKIDRSFVSEMGAKGERSEIVRAIVNLAHNLGLDVIAEGVETQAQLDHLHDARVRLRAGLPVLGTDGGRRGHRAGDHRQRKRCLTTYISLGYATLRPRWHQPR